MGEEVVAVSVGALVAAVLVAAVAAASISQSGSSVGHYVLFFEYHEAESECVRDHNSGVVIIW